MLRKYGCLILLSISTHCFSATHINHIDWLERLKPNVGILEYDSSLLGEKVDLESGRLIFENVDVSLPGLSKLPVEIRRKANPSQPLGHEFSDWSLEIPRISTNFYLADYKQGRGWGKNRCSQNLVNSIPNSRAGIRTTLTRPMPAHEFNSGINLDIPGIISSPIFDKAQGQTKWPVHADKVAKKNWYLTCISNIDGKGTEGFYAHSPDGLKYKFDVIKSKVVSKDRIYEFVYKDGSSLGSRDDPSPIFTGGEVSTMYSAEQNYLLEIMYVSEVTDKYGNWVKYQYDNDARLRRIYSNDGRILGLNYLSDTSTMVKSVIAYPNTEDERTWLYGYSNQTTTEWKAALSQEEAPSVGSVTKLVLNKVTNPDGRFWSYNIAGLYSKPIQGHYYRQRVRGDLFNNGPVHTCDQQPQKISIIHPFGTVGEFYLSERDYFNPVAVTGPYGSSCPAADPSSPHESPQTNPFTAIMSLDKKIIRSPSIPESTWTYSYSRLPSSENLMITTETRPDGSIKRYYHGSSDTNLALRKLETFENGSVTPTEVLTYQYTSHNLEGKTYLRPGHYGIQNDYMSDLRETKIEVIRSSDSTTTEYVYQKDINTPDYSFGHPTEVIETASGTNKIRRTKYEYLHDRSKWLIGLLERKYINSELVDSYQYSESGDVGAEYRFGQLKAKYCLYESGSVKWIKNALGEKTEYQNYFRGIPRLIIRADDKQYRLEINNFGQLVSETNWNGYETGYKYNLSGFIKEINYPGNYNSSYIEYTPLTDGLLQTTTTGNLVTSTRYDTFLRKVESVIGANSPKPVTLNTEYDIFNRKTFVSLPYYPGGDSSLGIRNNYDSINRLTQSTNTATGATTRYSFQSGNKVVETDPLGFQTTNTFIALGSFANLVLVKQQKPEDITTEFNYDSAMLKIDNMAQIRANNSRLVTHYFYDQSDRLCRLRMPEKGDVLYAYDTADRLITYADGQAAGDGCTATIGSANKVTMHYDTNGNLTEMHFPQSTTTPSIYRTYDNNGNVKTVARGNSTWQYNYDQVDNLTSEILSIDSKTFEFSYLYDGDRLLRTRTHPSGHLFHYTYDAHGRVSSIASSLSGSIIPNISYFETGGFEQVSRPSNLNSVYTLDAAKRLRSHTNPWGGNLVYSYNLRNQITNINSTDSRYVQSFGYDKVGRLTAASGTWGTGEYHYDSLSNLTYKREGNRTVDISYSTATNRVNQVKDSKFSSAWITYSHDSSGNVTFDGVNTLTYDASSQPLSITGLTLSTNVYDGHKNRVKQTTNGTSTYSLYSVKGNLLATYDDNTGKYTDYISVASETLARINGMQVTYPINDHLGSAYAVMNLSGNIVPDSNRTYTPWGEVHMGNTHFSHGKQGFTGHIEDSSGLTYMKARYYNPAIGRFLSTDPIDYADQLNLYAYVGNDPINMVDPTGKASTPFTMMRTDQRTREIARTDPAFASQATAYQGAAVAATAIAITAVASPVGALAVSIGVETGTIDSPVSPRSNSADGVKLEKQLASEAQTSKITSGNGIPIAGAGTGTSLRASDRLAAEHGGNAKDWSKVDGGNHTASDGTKIETHGYQNQQTNQIVELKTKLRDENQ